MSETAERFIADAEFPTAVPARYLRQLCQHFQHKLPVELDELNGRITFPAGVCDVAADASAGRLRLRVVARDAAGLLGLEDVVARHLLRFAFRERAEVVWHATQ